MRYLILGLVITLLGLAGFVSWWLQPDVGGNVEREAFNAAESEAVTRFGEREALRRRGGGRPSIQGRGSADGDEVIPIASPEPRALTPAESKVAAHRDYLRNELYSLNESLESIEGDSGDDAKKKKDVEMRIKSMKVQLEETERRLETLGLGP